MDLVECEAPLDSSFQKDRLELVNKGSLGRRRKPSRSNLRLILSPADDRQDIDVFHSHQHFESDGSQTRENGKPNDPFKENALDNRNESAVIAGDRRKSSSDLQKRDHCFKNSYQNGVVSNYREVVESISQIHSIKCVDFNGNSHQPLVSSGYLQNYTNGDHVSIIQNGQLKIKSENNNVKPKDHVQTSVITSQRNADSNSHQVFTKLNNSNHVTKSNSHSKNQNTSESNICQKTVHIRNQHNERKVPSNNHQNVITFSNHRQIVTSTPIQSKKSDVPNGKYREWTSPQDCSSKVCIESSLPRTSKETNLVAEAQQFSIEAKLKRKKSEVQGRSAVLIQTWERRTQSESYSKLRRDSKTTTLKNRFSGKEISDANSTVMPDSYICIKYKGSLQHGDNLLRGELVPSVRDASPAETMLYRVPESRHQTVGLEKTADDRVVVNGKSSVQEPEWISLSRKLCAKFVEGHIESHSPDSYPHEEPEGVGEEPTPSLQSIKTHSGTNTALQTEVQKRKMLPTTPCEDAPSSDEPPWIHLSRKLCTKFIEEHIEYPPITNGHFVEVPELVEPNGDVRIIEKIGKPKGYKSKQKKECEPEWISLSKRLRAKFIESHIDDPDTIALDNQLNASDPEEIGSETLSDISQETPIPQKVTKPHGKVESRNFTTKSEQTKENYACRENENNQNSNESVTFPDKECCWEYQEMEFDQESNSGNFQEIEFFDHPPREGNYKIHQKFLPQDSSDKFGERMTFENSRSQQNPECYNNDVKFAPRDDTDDSACDFPQGNKMITVQFIAHTGNESNYKHEKVDDNSHNNKNDSFFNLSTWEEAQYNQTHEDAQQVSENATSCKNCLSISIENLCDRAEENVLLQNEEFDRKETQPSSPSMDVISTEDDYFPDSEKFPNSEETGMHFHEEKQLEPECSSSMSSIRNSPYGVTEDTVRESERESSSWSNFYDEKKQNIYDAINVQSSSEDEVFECDSRNKKLNSYKEVHNCETSGRKSPSLENEKCIEPRKVMDQKVKSDPSKTNNKSIKCNGMIPNSIYDSFPDNKKPSDKNNQNEVGAQKSAKEPTKLGMSKWITISKSEQNINKPEYSNVQSSIHKTQSNGKTPSEIEVGSKNKSKKNNKVNKNSGEKKTNCLVSDKNSRSKYENDYPTSSRKTSETSYKNNGAFKEADLRAKCKSLCDISYIDSEGSFRQHESVADLCSATRPSNHHKIEFQHFEFNSEIPLCAKLVSRHDRKNASKSIPELATNRMESPCPSDSSHVYEDMFKETPSGPSDSEASSWTAMKNNTYYVNGRSCSMNDLDFSDSCSMSVKCDYASSSENSTLQSRHSSYASSSFYVNLRDYDSHMLEPNLSKGRKSNGKLTKNGAISNFSKSNPPTPESLRHLFTSPLSSVHSAPNRTPRPLNRMPSDPQSHYYSTAAAATSSAFKHGFNLTPAKPKKTERSSSVKIKDIAHGILLTFKKFQNNSKNSSMSSTQHVDVSHLAEMRSNAELVKSKKGQKDSKKHDKNYWAENGKAVTDSDFLSDVKRAKARRSSSDSTGMKPNPELFHSDKKKGKSSKKGSKGKKNKMKVSEPRVVPTVSRKVQQMADGTLYLVTTVSGDTTLPGVYSDSPDTSSELSSHRPVKLPEESNC